MSIVHLTKGNFEQEVLKSDKKVVIDFWAAWCGPCQMLGPVFEAVSEEMPNYKFCKVDVDSEQELAAQHGVMTIPTLVVYDKGQIEKRVSGAMNASGLKKFLA